jgi:hypothetical protein
MLHMDLSAEPSVTAVMTPPPNMLDATTADQLLPLLISAVTALVENSDVWLPEPVEPAEVEARFTRVEVLGEDIAALARTGRAVSQNRNADGARQNIH